MNFTATGASFREDISLHGVARYGSIFFNMASKKNFVLRIDETTYEALEKWAADEFRSVNGQLEWVIHQALRQAGRIPKPKKAPDPGSEPTG